MDLRTAKTLSPREYHGRRTAERRAAQELFRERKLRQVRQAIRRLAPNCPAVRAVYLFGSVLCPGQFRAGSDVDVALECDDIEVETPFARALEREIGMPVDLRPLRGAVADAVRDSGEKVYG